MRQTRIAGLTRVGIESVADGFEEAPRERDLDAYGKLTMHRSHVKFGSRVEAERVKAEKESRWRSTVGSSRDVRSSTSLGLPSGISLPAPRIDSMGDEGYSTNAGFNSNERRAYVEGMRSQGCKRDPGVVTSVEVPLVHYSLLRDQRDTSLLHHAQDEFRNLPKRLEKWAEDDLASAKRLEDGRLRQDKLMEVCEDRVKGKLLNKNTCKPNVPKLLLPEDNHDEDEVKTKGDGIIRVAPAEERSAWQAGRSSGTRLMRKWERLQAW